MYRFIININICYHLYIIINEGMNVIIAIILFSFSKSLLIFFLYNLYLYFYITYWNNENIPVFSKKYCNWFLENENIWLVFAQVSTGGSGKKISTMAFTTRPTKLRRLDFVYLIHNKCIIFIKVSSSCLSCMHFW